MSTSNTGSSLGAVILILAFIAWISTISIGGAGFAIGFLPIFGIVCSIKLLWAALHL